MTDRRVNTQITRKSLPARLEEASIAFTTVHDPAQGGRLLYVIDGERMTHGEVEKRYPHI